jgi:hypothetical protein
MFPAVKRVTNSELTFRVVTLAIEATRFVVKEFKLEIVMTLSVPTFAVVDCKLVSASEFKFEIVKTFRVPTLAVEATRFVVRVARLETDKTLRVPTLAVEATRFVVRVARLATERTFNVPTLAIEANKLVVSEDKLETVRTLRVPTFASVATKLVVRELKFEIERMFRVPIFAVETIRFAVFEVPDTFRDVSVPTLVIFGWDACETTRATVAFATLPTKFDELRDEIDDPFPAMFVKVAVPRTYRFDPFGGLLIVPMDTPYP